MWPSAYPSKCRGDLFCALPLSVEAVLLERGVVYSRLYLPKSSVEVPCVDELVEILLCEGGDVGQWLEPRNKSCCLRLIH